MTPHNRRVGRTGKAPVSKTDTAERLWGFESLTLRLQARYLAALPEGWQSGRMHRGANAEDQMVSEVRILHPPLRSIVVRSTARSDNSIGRVPVFQTGCRGFDPHSLHLKCAKAQKSTPW